MSKIINEFQANCFQSLEYFGRAYWEYTKQWYRETTYQPLIYNNIQNTIINEDVNKNLIICIPPRVGKSTIARLAIAWNILIADGDADFIIIAYSNVLAHSHGTNIRDIVNTDFFKNLCDDTLRISTSESAKDMFSIQKRVGNDQWARTGTIRSCSVASPITGFGAGRGQSAKGRGFMLLDDLNNPNDLTQSAYSDVVHRYNTTIQSRKNHPGTPIISIQQRLHTDDITGYFLNHEPERWDTLILPAETKEGKLLDPVLLPKSDLEEKKQRDPVMYQAQYLQQPINIETEQPIDVSKIRFYTTTPDLSGFTILATGDYALTEKETADYSCCFIVAKRGQECVILDYFISKETIINTVERTAQLFKKWKPLYFYMERGGIYNAMEPLLKNKMSELGIWVALEPYTRTKSKLAMSQGLIYAINNGYLHIPQGIDGQILDQLEKFPNGRHDDAVDALAGIYLGNNAEYNKVVQEISSDYGEYDFEPDIDTF